MITPEIEIRINELRDEGFSWDHVAEATGVARRTIQRWRKRKMIEAKPISKLLVTAEVAARIHELRAEGFDWNYIAEVTSTSRSTLLRWRKNRNLAFARYVKKPGARPPGVPTRIDTAFATQIKELRAEGVSWDDIATKLRVSRSSLLRWRVREGYDTPPKFRLIQWTQEMHDTIRSMRAARRSWDDISAAIGVTRDTCIREGGKIGAPLGELPKVEPVSPAMMRAGNSAPLPAGSPETWGLLTSLTISLRGAPYVPPAPLR